MWSANKNWKCCATCANWAGNRKVDYAKTAVVDSVGESGKCYCNVFYNPHATQGTNCSKYSLWAALR